jgi:hypothetical protein
VLDMTTQQPAPTLAAHGTYWQAPTAAPEAQLLPHLRARLVALVAALVVQATIAAAGVLPALPGATASTDPYALYAAGSQPVSFWMQFAVLEALAALVVSLAFGPGVRIGDVPAVGRLVLALAFVVLPAAAIVLGAIEAQAVGGFSPATAASSWLSTAFFSTLFFGLPLLALVAPGSRRPSRPAGTL